MVPLRSHWCKCLHQLQVSEHILAGFFVAENFFAEKINTACKTVFPEGPQYFYRIMVILSRNELAGDGSDACLYHFGGNNRHETPRDAIDTFTYDKRCAGQARKIFLQ